MSMRSSTRNELSKLRELMRYLLHGKRCRFCGELLLPASAFENHEPGSGRGRPLPEILDITEHHKDGNHGNNDIDNREPTHASCHRRFHLNERRQQSAAGIEAAT